MGEQNDRDNLRHHMGDQIMKDAAVASEIADPFATLETILKIINRSWLSEEWRLEDIRLLAQETLAKRGRSVPKRLAEPDVAAPVPPRSRRTTVSSTIPRHI
ncbi:hypothetical protein [Microvirga arsenatis]|uniref:Uncharacterized protein n=1 Tax=Microvirga arsenatis TaxID=2692265 RepID=A0ABW9Z443_9HYPH|nr:hypothetical protein [Microvirga arsenatis]NBJ13845.1 hypothetical protein [Microvirga arsenatis]NBJ27300.1 hypothetical protein [Microvirga arsenatis]